MKRSPYWLRSGLLSHHPVLCRGKEWGAQDRLRSPVLAGKRYPASRSVASVHHRTFQRTLPVPGRAKSSPSSCLMRDTCFRARSTAYSYKLLQTAFSRVLILIGRATGFGFRGISVSQYSGYKTPLGVAPVEPDVTKKLLSSPSADEMGFSSNHQEHSLEIQIPFIQTV